MQALFFEADHDNNADGVPNNIGLFDRISTALLVDESGGRWSATAFPHGFAPTTGELSSNYEQVLPSAYDMPTTWSQRFLRLGFWTQGYVFRTRPGEYDPARYRYGHLDLQQKQRSAYLKPGESFRVDHEYCFNEVQLAPNAE